MITPLPTVETPRTERCGSCRYWVDTSDDAHQDDRSGDCHRGLRHVAASISDVGEPARDGWDWYWPIHHKDDWCGEWEGVPT